MSYTLFSPTNIGQVIIPAGQLSSAIFAYQKDLQTGLVDVDFPGKPRYHLLFAHGELINTYKGSNEIRRIDQRAWNKAIDEASSSVSLRALALTPQAVRIVKILFEQLGDTRNTASVGQSLESLLDIWGKHPINALTYIRWPNAEAVALLPGDGAYPLYTLFVTADQMLHSTGTMTALYRWREPFESAVLLSSEPRTLAWTEYLLHHSFSQLITHLLERLRDTTERTVFNNMVRDINFTSSAHGWGVLIHQASITDQTIFPSPKAAAEIYSRLMEVIFDHIESITGSVSLNNLIREIVLLLPMASRLVLEEYLLPSTSPYLSH